MDLSSQSSTWFAIRAEVAGTAPVGSVKLALSGPNRKTVTDNASPYVIRGDDGNGDYWGMNLPNGTYRITATPYTGANGSGEALPALSRVFTVTGSYAADAAPVERFVLADAAGDGEKVDIGPIANGATVDLSSRNSTWFAIRAEVAGTAPVGSVKLALSGPNRKAVTDNASPYVIRGDDGNGDYWGMNLPNGSYTITATPYVEPKGRGMALKSLEREFTVTGSFDADAAPVTGFTLVDTSGETARDVGPIADGAEVDVYGLSSVTIRAELTSEPAVGSVKLALGGRSQRRFTDNARPYTLHGNNGNGGLNGASLAEGGYTITATPHIEPKGRGMALRSLTRGFTLVRKAPTLSAADAEAHEGETMAFRVALSGAASEPVTVDYATEDVTAQAGSDYSEASGTLTFAVGETAKTVSVALSADTHDDDGEKFKLVLRNASGAEIADGEAIGTIRNTAPIPRAWLARFGRTVTGQVLDAVAERLAAPRTPGMEARLAGQALPSWTGGAAANGDSGPGVVPERASFDAGAGDRDAMSALAAWLWQAGPDGTEARGSSAGWEGGSRLESRALSGRDLVTGTSFALTGGSVEGGGFGALWGRGAVARFDGREGALTLDGEVTTGMVGADVASGRWQGGLVVSHSRGEGSYRLARDGGEVVASLTGLYPYGGLTVSERLSVWGAAGYGAGEVTVTPEGEGPLTADLRLAMGAAGVRSEVLRPGDEGGLSLAVKGDARFTRTSSDRVEGPEGSLNAADADAWLARAGVEGSRRIALGADGPTLTPSLEVGLRLDGGDAESGFGADVGGGLALAAGGLEVDVKARGLLAHEASGFREWGASAALAFDPAPSSSRGLSLSVRQHWGALPAGGMDALLGRESLAGLAPEPGEGGFGAARRLEAEVGYGLPVFGVAFVGTPHAGLGLTETGRDYTLGWRLVPAAPGAAGFELRLEATRAERDGGAPPEHGLTLRFAAQW